MNKIEFEAKAKKTGGTSTIIIVPAYLAHKHDLKDEMVKVTLEKIKEE